MARAYEHEKIIELKHSYWVAIGVEDVAVVDTMLACARHDHRLHSVNLS